MNLKELEMTNAILTALTGEYSKMVSTGLSKPGMSPKKYGIYLQQKRMNRKQRGRRKK